jgi:hypothetical protein
MERSFVLKKKRLFCLMTLLFAVLLIFTLTGCDNLLGDGADTWNIVTSLNQLHGTWTGTFSQFMTLREYVENIEGAAWTPAVAATYGDISLTLTVGQTSIINSETRIQTGNQIDTYVFTGGNIINAWPLLKQSNPSRPGFLVLFNDSNHTMVISRDIPPQMVSMINFLGSQINQDDTKVKIPAGYYWEGSPEVILSKLNN